MTVPLRNPTDNHTREHEYLRFLSQSLSNVLQIGALSPIVFIFLSKTVSEYSAVWILWRQRPLWQRGSTYFGQIIDAITGS